MTDERDDRPIVKVFLASGREFESERKEFEAIIKRLAALSSIARRFRLVPIHWQQGGGDVGKGTLQKQIEASVDMASVPIVLLLVGTYVGPGTREEYDTALSLRKAHGAWPQLFAYFKVREDGVTLLGDSKVMEFHQRLIEDQVTVPGHFRDLQEIEDRFGKLLVELLVPAHRSDSARGETLRKQFILWATIGFCISAAAIFVSSTMAFPTNAVSWTRVFLILAAPPVIFLLGITAIWLFSRLIKEFHFAWNSVSYSDDRMFRVFKNLIPSGLVPSRIRSRFPSSSIGNGLNIILLFFALATPLVAQFDCIFHEMLEWDYVVDPDKIVGAAGPQNHQNREPVLNRFVEKGPLTWPYTLKNSEVVKQRAETSGVVYVYAPGMLGDGRHFGTAQAFRENIGPEVFLPFQPLLYIVLLAIHTVLTVWLAIKLIRLSHDVSQQKALISALTSRS